MDMYVASLRSGDLAPTEQRINDPMHAVEVKTALPATTVTSTRAPTAVTAPVAV
jgi:hypothetical protein